MFKALVYLYVFCGAIFSSGWFYLFILYLVALIIIIYYVVIILSLCICYVTIESLIYDQDPVVIKNWLFLQLNLQN